MKKKQKDEYEFTAKEMAIAIGGLALLNAAALLASLMIDGGQVAASGMVGVDLIFAGIAAILYRND